MAFITAMFVFMGVCMDVQESGYLPNKCTIHSYYKGIRPPKSDCPKCWEFYTQKNPAGVLEVETFETSLEKVKPPAIEQTDFEKVAEIEFMVDYIRKYNHFSKKEYKDGIAPASEIDGDFDAERQIVTEDYLYRIAEDMYNSAHEEWFTGITLDPLILLTIARYETGFRTWASGDSGKAHSLFQLRQEWHRKRMYVNGKAGPLVNEVKDKNGNPVVLEWGNNRDMTRYTVWLIEKQLNYGNTLFKALGPWTVRADALKEYNRIKD
jgi:hypothetical protein